MNMLRTIRSFVPLPVKRWYWHVTDEFQTKYDAEHGYWKGKFTEKGGRFKNGHYERLFLAMGQEKSHEFLRNRIVADFGCGPRGSHEWASEAKARNGIDVLSDQYASEFEVRGQDIVDFVASEDRIPLPSNYIDIMFSLNALDHADNFRQICREIVRVVAPGGLFIASFNLEEEPTKCEPQTLTETKVKRYLLDHLDIVSYRVAIKGGYTVEYEDMIAGNTVASAQKGVASILWVRATKQR
ncbi:MAG TPA: class I SAM-dependent methyltransferase [Terriglobia bacterium]|nr:class I SAM-dependent methyltransferase [Terriglobia bacterium]